MTTWGVRTASGTLVRDLPGLAHALHTDRATAAKSLMADATLFRAAPPSLRAEAKAAARKKPGGGTPPPISTGNFVSWSGGKGRVDLLVRNGKVPGVSGDVEGTAKSPAARIVVWRDGKPTREKIAKSTHTLRRIPPIKQGKSAGSAALVSALTAHEGKCDDLDLPEHARVSGRAIKAVYDRGLATWPGASSTSLSREEWALGRVEHFTKVAAGDVDRKRAGHDLDLLHPAHPFVSAHGEVRMSRADVDAQIKELFG